MSSSNSAKRQKTESGDGPQYEYSFKGYLEKPAQEYDDDEEDKEEEEDESDYGESTRVDHIVGKMKASGGSGPDSEIGRLSAYWFHDDPHFDWVYQADEIDQNLYDTVNTLFDESELKRSMLKGAWSGFDMGGGDLVVLDDVNIAQAHRGSKLGLKLVEAFIKWVREETGASLILLSPGFTERSTSKDWSAQERAEKLDRQIAYWSQAGFRMMVGEGEGGSNGIIVLGYAMDEAHPSHATPVITAEGLKAATEAATAAKAAEKEAIRAQIAQEEAAAKGRGLSGIALTQHMIAFCKQLDRDRSDKRSPEAKREEEERVHKLRERYPMLVARTEARGEPLVHLLSFPHPILQCMETHMREIVATGGSAAGPWGDGSGGGQRCSSGQPGGCQRAV